jgi:NhaA family Na+:H+ antiporter
MKDSLPGLALVLAAALAMWAANGPFASLYTGTLAQSISIVIGELALGKTVLHWINDGFMSVFFLAVGLEIAREWQEGELTDRRRAALPIAGAIGGMVMPAVVFWFVTSGEPDVARGAAIPTATDIAFALGVFALLQHRLAPGLRIFLLGLAVIDDLGAIVLIALLFTNDLSAPALLGAGICVIALIVARRSGIRRLAPYLCIGAALWLLVLKSGVHATLAGVILGLCIPGGEPRRTLEHALHPIVTWGILPLFAFANAGANLAGAGAELLLQPVTLGVASGLFIGKQVGVLIACWLAVRCGVASLPTGADWRSLHGVAILTGIGFTMSLFIGSLAFPADDHADAVRFGVVIGSTCSALAGLAWLSFVHRDAQGNNRRAPSNLFEK